MISDHSRAVVLAHLQDLSAMISGEERTALPTSQKVLLLLCCSHGSQINPSLCLHRPTPSLYRSVAGAFPISCRRRGRVLWTTVRPPQHQQEATLAKRGERAQSRQQAAEPPSTVRDRKLEEEMWEQLQPGRRKAAEVRKSQKP